MITYDDFLKVDIRVGKITKVEDFSEARNPSFKLEVDFGDEIGIKKSAAQLVNTYSKEDLLGLEVIAVVNFPPKQIGPTVSEVLILGVPDSDNKKVILVRPDNDVELGGRLF
jgi:tRNA-binding protein